MGNAEVAMREPDIDAVNRTLSVVVQKQSDELKQAYRRNITLCKLIVELAEILDRAGYPVTAQQARDAAA